MLTHPYYFINYKQLFPIKPKLNKTKTKTTRKYSNRDMREKALKLSSAG